MEQNTSPDKLVHIQGRGSTSAVAEASYHASPPQDNRNGNGVGSGASGPAPMVAANMNYMNENYDAVYTTPNPAADTEGYMSGASDARYSAVPPLPSSPPAAAAAAPSSTYPSAADAPQVNNNNDSNGTTAKKKKKRNSEQNNGGSEGINVQPQQQPSPVSYPSPEGNTNQYYTNHNNSNSNNNNNAAAAMNNNNNPPSDNQVHVPPANATATAATKPSSTSNRTTMNSTNPRAATTNNSKQQAQAEMKEIRERRNWLIHQLFTRQEYVDCLDVIEVQLRDTDGTCEYALYVKGLLKRMAGELTESLQLLQAAVLVSPENTLNRKQLGRALFLMGRHLEAIEIFEEVETLRVAKGLSPDWEIPLSIGLCYQYLQRYVDAAEAFYRSITIQKNDTTLLHLIEVLVLQNNYEEALSLCQWQATESSGGNPEILSLLGHLYLHTRQTPQAFLYLGQCLTLDPIHTKALMSAASLIQDNGDYDVALRKYRIVAAYEPNSPQLWNNIGVCFLGKKNQYAAIACLRKSILLGPFEWISNYNTGLVFLSMERYASAFHHLSAAISLHNEYAPSYMFLGVCLSLMNDIENACHAYEKALRLSDDYLFRLNFAVTLFNSNCLVEAKEQFQLFLATWNELTPEQKRAESAAIPNVVRHLQAVLKGGDEEEPQPMRPQASSTTTTNNNNTNSSHSVLNNMSNPNNNNALDTPLMPDTTSADMVPEGSLPNPYRGPSSYLGEEEEEELDDEGRVIKKESKAPSSDLPVGGGGDNGAQFFLNANNDDNNNDSMRSDFSGSRNSASTNVSKVNGVAKKGGQLPYLTDHSSIGGSIGSAYASQLREEEPGDIHVGNSNFNNINNEDEERGEAAMFPRTIAQLPAGHTLDKEL